MEKFFRYSLTACILFVVSMQFLQIVFRYCLEMPMIIFDEMILFPTIWMYFVGCANAAREGTQITANVVDTFIKSERVKLGVNAVAMMFSTGISAWLTVWAFEYFSFSLRVWKKTSYAFFPLFFAESAVFVGMVAITWFTFVWFYLQTKRTIQYKEATPA